MWAPVLKTFLVKSAMRKLISMLSRVWCNGALFCLTNSNFISDITRSTLCWNFCQGSWNVIFTSHSFIRLCLIAFNKINCNFCSVLHILNVFTCPQTSLPGPDTSSLFGSVTPEAGRGTSKARQSLRGLLLLLQPPSLPPPSLPSPPPLPLRHSPREQYLPTIWSNFLAKLKGVLTIEKIITLFVDLIRSHRLTG